MSGLFGVLDSKNQLQSGILLDQMVERMSHFGWHSHHIFHDTKIDAGLGLIGIGVFNSEPQPLASEDGRFVIFLSGEIDRAQDLRRGLERKGYRFSSKSDAEVALKLFEDCGEAFIDQLRGSFLVAVWDTVRARLLVANDRFGTYPLYYAHYQGKLLFAPEVKAILCDPAFDKKLNLTALAEYIRFQAVLGDKSFFEGINLLRGANLLVYDLDEDELVLREYWNYSKIPLLPTTLSFEDAVEESARLLTLAINKYPLVGFTPGLLLSGGLDSRAILGFMGPQFDPLTTVTYGAKDCKDVIYARALARRKATRHHFIEFKSGEWVSEFTSMHLMLTEGNHSWIHGHGLNTMHEIRSLLDVNYSGFAGDLGIDDLVVYYPPDELAFHSRLYDEMCSVFTWPSVTEGEAAGVFSPAYAGKMKDLARESLYHEIDLIGDLPYTVKASAMCLTYDMHMYFHYVTFHRAFIEDRFPFLDYDYIDFSFAIPPEFELNRKLRKELICSKMPGLAGVPYAKDDLPISDNPARFLQKLALKGMKLINGRFGGLFEQPCVFYADYESWMRDELKDWAENILFGPKMMERGIFNPSYLKSMWARLQSGREANLIGKIAPLMTYEMMLQQFLD